MADQLKSPKPDAAGMRRRRAAAEERYLDGKRDRVVARLHAYVLCAAGCPCGGRRG